jgi:hypothetical protein
MTAILLDAGPLIKVVSENCSVPPVLTSNIITSPVKARNRTILVRIENVKRIFINILHPDPLFLFSAGMLIYWIAGEGAGGTGVSPGCGEDGGID